MIYTTHGAMTPADMADMADLYDWNLEAREAQAEEEAMEDAHAAHADQCRACQEEATQRETTARVALQMDIARRALEEGLDDALRNVRLPEATRKRLLAAKAEAWAALRSI